MSTSTLPNIRVSSDLTVRLKLKDGGVAIDWSTLSNIRALIYSDAQRAMAGRCAVTVDAEDSTLLVCQYAANKPQYIGVNRIVISATYLGEMKTYDKPALNFVRWTDDQAGEEITISDPDVEVEIEVEDVSSSILQEAVDAAFSAADRANDAAEAAEHMVDIHTGPAGKSPYIGENGHWYEWDETAQEYVDTETEAQGETGTTPDITIGTVTTAEPGTPAAATMTGTPEAPVLNLTIPKGVAGDTPNFTVGEVTTGQPGTPVVVTITGTAAAPVLNVQIPQGLQGNPGSSVDYPFELVNNATTNDATKAATAAVAKGLKDDITQLEHKVDSLPRGKDYGFFTSSSDLPSDATEEGFAYVGATEPYAIWQFDGTSWSDSGVTANAFTANDEQVADAVDDYLDEHPAVIGTMPNSAKRALIALLEKVAFIDQNGQQYINQLNAALNDVAIDHIEAVYTQGSTRVFDNGLSSLDDLREKLVVTAYYVDGTHGVIDDYELSGTLTAGTSTITVTADEATDTFDVVVSATLKLYHEGDECTSVTGGWQTKGFNMTGGTPSKTKEATDLLIKFGTSANAGAAGSWSTTNKITLTGYNRFVVKAEFYNASGRGALWGYWPATLAEATSQTSAYGSDYSSNRISIKEMGRESDPSTYPFPTPPVEQRIVRTFGTSRTQAYLSLNLNLYTEDNVQYTAGAYVKIKQVFLANVPV